MVSGPREDAARGVTDPRPETARMMEFVDRCCGSLTERIAARMPDQVRRSVSPAEVLAVARIEAVIRAALTPDDDPLRDEQAFEAWVLGIADECMSDVAAGLSGGWRSDSRHRVSAPPGPTVDDAYEALLQGLGVAGGADSRDRVEAAIAALPTDYARVIRLCELQRRAPDDVSAALEVTEGAVHMLLGRARSHMRVVLTAPSGAWMSGPALSPFLRPEGAEEPI